MYKFDVVKMLKYATVENAYRYRAIIRFLYEQYERFKYYSKTEEILDFLHANKLVEEEYDESILYEDLKQLEKWECVLSRQDKEVVYTIEEFKNRKLKFQITQALFEIETTLKRIDDLEDELTGALESREFERILKGVNELHQVNLEESSGDVIYEKWNSLMKSLANLKRNSTNYLAHLKGEQAEILFKTEEFLLYKEKFVDYLTKFILTMSQNKYKIAASISRVVEDDGFISNYIDHLVEYFSSIPTLDGQVFDKERSKRIQMEKWMELVNWFVKNEQSDCDVKVLLRETEVSIQTMSRYALRFSEMKGNNQNRKRDYQTLASMFYVCKDIEEAHQLSAACFGISHTKHFYGEDKSTDTQNEEIWEQDQPIITTTPRNRTYQRTKRIKSYVKASDEERQVQVETYMKNREHQQNVIESLIVDNKMILRNLGTVDPFVRKSILTWITRGVQNRNRAGRTDFGTNYKFDIVSDEKVKLVCHDGIMWLPDLEFEFSGGETNG